MCTICQALQPEIETYDFHDLPNMAEPTVSAMLPTEGTTGDSQDLPFYSYDQIADYLISGYWEEDGSTARSFDVTTGDTLTVDLSGLGAKGAAAAQQALDAWTAASGLKFEQISQSDATFDTTITGVVTEQEDAVDNASTTARMNVGEKFVGTIENATGRDWVGITLEAGKTYSISLEGDGSANQLTDTVLRLYSDTGAVMMANNDASNSTSYSALEFTASETGTYFLEADAMRMETGAYSMTVFESEKTITPDITFREDQGGAFAGSFVVDGVISSSSVNVSAGWSNYGNFYLQTYIHEIGHALGLGHAGYYNTTASFGSDAHYANDSVQTTVMSYFTQDNNPYTDASALRANTAMMADVVAIQKLYGTPVDTHAGNSVYGDNQNTGQFGMDLTDKRAVTIVDSGGIDLIDLSSRTGAQHVDLREGSFSDISGKVGNVAISIGTVIENATTGSGNDSIIGNAVGNVLSGGSGDDMLDGGAGADVLTGGAGSDTIIGGAGADTAVFDGGIADYRVVYDAGLANNGVLKIKTADGAEIDTLTGIETLSFGDASKSVAELVSELIAEYGAITAGSSASFVSELENIGTPEEPPVVEPPVVEPPLDDTVLQIGNTRVHQSSSSEWHTVTFDQVIKDAVVIMGPASGAGEEEVTLRVRNVTDTGFEFQLDEWDYRDGSHVAENVSWIAGSAGSHTLADGTKIQLGARDAVSMNSTLVNLEGFSDKPMVFGQLSGDAEDRALTHRLENIGADNFRFTVQDEDAAAPATDDIADELLYWMALDVADGSSIFERGLESISHSAKDIGTVLEQTEAFFADMQSFKGVDASVLRYNTDASGNVQVYVEEETSADSEIRHMNESVAWFTADTGVFDLI